jgi:ACR3 family arsenite efflux pump ArsB
MTRQTLEKYQVIVYLTAIGLGLGVGVLLPGGVGVFEAALWPVLGLLLYATFTQVPIAHLGEAIKDTRFVAAAIVGNFIVIPFLLWLSLPFLPADPAIRLGILLVLLVPCTDWFITFTHLGGGDTRHAIAFSPISLLLQMLLLPVYLVMFLGEEIVLTAARQEMLLAFAGLILLPLLAAFLTEKWTERSVTRREILEKFAWLPVPLLAVVVFIIAVTQINLVTASLDVLGTLLVIFVFFLIAAGLLARLISAIFGLPTDQGRVLAFSMGTRNSFVVLPLALALPESFGLTVVAIVFQSLVELIGMAVYLWWVPRVLFRQIDTTELS